METFETKKDESGTIKWIEYKIDGVILFAEFLNTAIVDGKNVGLEITVDPISKFIFFKLPFFWQYAVIDPSMYFFKFFLLIF